MAAEDLEERVHELEKQVANLGRLVTAMADAEQVGRKFEVVDREMGELRARLERQKG